LIVNGVCRPDWEAISRVVESLSQADWSLAWAGVARQWVNNLSREAGEAYRVFETDNFLIMTSAPDRIAQDACKSYESALKQIVSSLQPAAATPSFKQVVLMFADLDQYYGYIAQFYPEGEHPMSGGVCLTESGYVHFAFPTLDYSSYRTVLVHELTHGCLAHLPIPVWLNEGLAMQMEQAICGTQVFTMDADKLERHFAHWNAMSIQDFWTGESWNIPGDSFELSYNLAQVIWRKLQTDFASSREQVIGFVASASAEDAGEAAFQSLFNRSLEQVVAGFLGKGDWKPKPANWGEVQAEPE
jgi:hypothetical protein